MYEKSASFFEDFAKGLGLSIHIPRPHHSILKASAATNALVGLGLIAAGAVVSSKVLVGLGSLGLIGAGIVGHACKK